MVVLLAEVVVARLPHPAPLAVVVQLLDPAHLVPKARLAALLPVVALLPREAQLLRPELLPAVLAVLPVPLPQQPEVAAVVVLVQGLVASEILRSR